MAGTVKKPASGNRTDRRGRKHVQNLHISKEAAASLRVLWRRAQGTRPDVTEEQLVEELIEREWRAYDAKVSKLWDGEIL